MGLLALKNDALFAIITRNPHFFFSCIPSFPQEGIFILFWLFNGQKKTSLENISSYLYVHHTHFKHYGIHAQKTRTHEITNFVQILNELMKLVSLCYDQKQQKESNVLYIYICNLNFFYTIEEF